MKKILSIIFITGALLSQDWELTINIQDVGENAFGDHIIMECCDGCHDGFHYSEDEYDLPNLSSKTAHSFGLGSCDSKPYTQTTTVESKHCGGILSWADTGIKSDRAKASMANANPPSDPKANDSVDNFLNAKTFLLDSRWIQQVQTLNQLSNV